MMSRVPSNLAKCIAESRLQEKCRKTERTEHKQYGEHAEFIHRSIRD